MTSEIPVIDLGDFLKAKPGARERTAGELQRACEQVGFFFISGHGVAQDLIDAVFEASARFHALPLAEKEALKANEHNIGYMAYKASVSEPLRALA